MQGFTTNVNEIVLHCIFTEVLTQNIFRFRLVLIDTSNEHSAHCIVCNSNRIALQNNDYGEKMLNA